jgi:hypothetical protein
MGNTATYVKTITSCNDCPHCQRDRVYTADSFEHVEKFTCLNVKKPKVISEYVDWHEKVSIPDWCPLLKVN